MKISIITDGNNNLGMGHIYQASTLAYELSKKIDYQSKIYFITKSDQLAIDRLSETGFEVYKYPNDEAILDSLIRENPDRIIFDKLDVSPQLARQIKDTIDCKLIIFTNLTDANEHADITVLAGMGSNFTNVCKKNEASGAVHYYGPKYWIMRQEFFKYKRMEKKRPSTVKRIMLMFGGVDESNLTSKVLNKLMRLDIDFDIVIVVGAAFNHHGELNAIVENNKFSRCKLVILQNAKNVAEMMYNSDVVFTSPGLSYYEALVTGTPVVGFHQNEMQREVHKEYLKTLDVSDLDTLASIIENKSFIFPDEPLIVSMEIGQGKDELIQTILS